MTSLTDELEADRARNSPVCFIRRTRATDPALADEIVAALAGPYSHNSMLRALSKRGVKVGKDALVTHRRGGCPQCQTS